MNAGKLARGIGMTSERTRRRLIEKLREQGITDERVLGAMTETPVKTEFGWHVIKVEDRRKSSAPPFERVRAQIARDLGRRIATDVLNSAREGAKIERFALDGQPLPAPTPPSSTPTTARSSPCGRRLPRSPPRPRGAPRAQSGPTWTADRMQCARWCTGEGSRSHSGYGMRRWKLDFVVTTRTRCHSCCRAQRPNLLPSNVTLLIASRTIQQMRDRHPSRPLLPKAWTILT